MRRAPGPADRPPSNRATRRPSTPRDEVAVGAIIVATGLRAVGPEKVPYDGYGKYKNVFTALEVERLVNAAERTGARALLISTIVTHARVHEEHMRRLHALARQRGLRERLVLIAGGTQVTDDLARECGMDAGFGRGMTGRDVASFLVRTLRAREGK